MTTTDAATGHAQAHAHRALTHFLDAAGAAHLELRSTVEDIAAVMAVVEARAEAHFEQARRQGRHEPYVAYRADAVVGLVTDQRHGEQGGSRVPGAVSLRVDLAALRRGELAAGECCEIPGVGPVPLASARALVGEGF